MPGVLAVHPGSGAPAVGGLDADEAGLRPAPEPLPSGGTSMSSTDRATTRSPTPNRRPRRSGTATARRPGPSLPPSRSATAGSWCSRSAPPDPAPTAPPPHRDPDGGQLTDTRHCAVDGRDDTIPAPVQPHPLTHRTAPQPPRKQPEPGITTLPRRPVRQRRYSRRAHSRLELRQHRGCCQPHQGDQAAALQPSRIRAVPQAGTTCLLTSLSVASARIPRRLREERYGHLGHRPLRQRHRRRLRR